MALLFVEGFEVLDASVPGKWNTVWNTLDSTLTRFNYGRSRRCDNNDHYLQKTIPASSKVIVGAAIHVNGAGNWVGNTSAIMLKSDAGLTTHLSLLVNADGSLKVCAGDGGVTLATSATGVFNVPNVWYQIEMSATIADSAGRVVVRVNGVTVIDFTGDTKNGGTNTTIDAIRFSAFRNDNGAQTTWDDIYICDGSGSVNNDFLGDVRVQTLLPTAAGASTQFTPLTGSNWDNVNDVGYNPATYNSSSTVGQRDTYTLSDIGADATVLGVQNSLLALKSDAGVSSIKGAVKSGGTVYYDPTRSLEASLAWYGAIREADPATSAAWTASGVNAMEFGAEVA